MDKEGENAEEDIVAVDGDEDEDTVTSQLLIYQTNFN
jgi:hypothetical protein